MVYRHNTTRCWALLCVAFVALASPAYGEQQAGIRSSQQQDSAGDEDEMRFRYFDNQAYLKELEERRRSQTLGTDQTNQTIIINKYSNRYRSQHHESWGVNYRTNDFSFSYQEGYRPNCCPTILVIPQREHYPPPSYYKRHSAPDGKRDRRHGENR